MGGDFNCFYDLILISHYCINSKCLSVSFVLDADLLCRVDLEISNTWGRKPAFILDQSKIKATERRYKKNAVFCVCRCACPHPHWVRFHQTRGASICGHSVWPALHSPCLEKDPTGLTPCQTCQLLLLSHGNSCRTKWKQTKIHKVT